MKMIINLFLITFGLAGSANFALSATPGESEIMEECKFLNNPNQMVYSNFYVCKYTNGAGDVNCIQGGGSQMNVSISCAYYEGVKAPVKTTIFKPDGNSRY